LLAGTGGTTVSTSRALAPHRKTKVFLLLFLQKKKILFFSEEKNQKTFVFWRAFADTGLGRKVDMLFWRRTISRMNSKLR
jgi:hypothetical protein